MLIPSETACLLSCGTPTQTPVQVFFTQPVPFLCDLYISQIVMAPPTPVNPTLVVMKYARTWTEAGGSGPRQVWRFLINVDLVFNPTGAGASPCPIPPCASLATPPARPVNFMGHIDYAYDCTNNAWSTCYSLIHFCGYFMHGPSSQRPLPPALAHQDRAYAFAGPAPFVFGPTPGPFGFLSADSQRSTSIDLNASPIVWSCASEHAIGSSLCGGGTAPCPCALSSSTGPLWSQFAIGWNVFCHSNFVSTFVAVPLPPYLPSGMGYMSLGSFGGAPGTFPGPRKIDSWIGLATAADPCPSQFFSLPFHIVHGVSHYGGDPGTTFLNDNGISVTTDRFFDFENMLIPNPTVPGGATLGIGSLFISSQVWGVCLV